MSIEAAVSLRLFGRFRRSAGGAPGLFSFDDEMRIDLRGGAGSNEADLLWRATRSIAGSANDDLDLNGGGLTDPFGNAVNFVELRAVYVRAADTNIGNIRVGGLATNRLSGLFATSSDFVDLRPGVQFFAVYPADGDLPVIPGTGDILRVTNLSTLPNSYTAMLIGTGS